MLRLVPFLTVICLAHPALASEPRSKVVVNGMMSPVYFNDGDTFRVLSGQLSGTKARLEGFNTLGVVRPGPPMGRLEFSRALRQRQGGDDTPCSSRYLALLMG